MQREEISLEIINTCLKMESLGLNQGTAGNISHKFKDGILITPSGLAYEKMKVDDIVYINENRETEKNKIPSSEWRFHFDILKAKPDCKAVVHNHAPYSTMVSILDIDFIPAIHYMIAIAGGSTIPCAKYATYGTKELSENILNVLDNRKACILKNHGLVTTDTTLHKALFLSQEVEMISRLYMGVANFKNFHILSDKEIEIVVEKFKNYGLNVKHN